MLNCFDKKLMKYAAHKMGSSLLLLGIYLLAFITIENQSISSNLKSRSTSWCSTFIITFRRTQRPRPNHRIPNYPTWAWALPDFTTPRPTKSVNQKQIIFQQLHFLLAGQPALPPYHVTSDSTEIDNDGIK